VVGGGGSDGAAAARSARRGCGPGQSQIERPGSGACAAPVLDEVANAGVRPGEGAAMNDPLA
jgi:hypothetical protein